MSENTELRRKDQKCTIVPNELLNKGNAIPEVERLFVHDVYNSIAPEWHSTRLRPWPKVRNWIDNLSMEGVFLDLGCGNGKYFPFLTSPNRYVIGLDYSIPLLKTSLILPKKGPISLLAADALHIPFHDNCFDGVISIALLHHISTEARRLILLKEMIRVLKKGCKALIYAWAGEDKVLQYTNNIEKTSKAKEQNTTETKEESTIDSQTQINSLIDAQNDVISSKTFTTRIPRESVIQRTVAPEQEVLVPWKATSGVVYERYCYLYYFEELSELVGRIPNCKLNSFYFDCGNHAFELLKI